jgi:hypothetical protein
MLAGMCGLSACSAASARNRLKRERCGKQHVELPPLANGRMDDLQSAHRMSSLST